jgi:hypothetical protein
MKFFLASFIYSFFIVHNNLEKVIFFFKILVKNIFSLSRLLMCIIISILFDNWLFVYNLFILLFIAISLCLIPILSILLRTNDISKINDLFLFTREQILIFLQITFNLEIILLLNWLRSRASL